MKQIFIFILTIIFSLMIINCSNPNSSSKRYSSNSDSRNSQDTSESLVKKYASILENLEAYYITVQSLDEYKIHYSKHLKSIKPKSISIIYGGAQKSITYHEATVLEDKNLKKINLLLPSLTKGDSIYFVTQNMTIHDGAPENKVEIVNVTNIKVSNNQCGAVIDSIGYTARNLIAVWNGSNITLEPLTNTIIFIKYSGNSKPVRYRPFRAFDFGDKLKHDNVINTFWLNATDSINCYSWISSDLLPHTSNTHPLNCSFGKD